MKKGTQPIYTLFCLIIFLVSVSFISAEVQTPTGTFTISNTVPPTPSGWQPDTTHDKSQNVSWVEGTDDNGDPITTDVCISADTDDDSCNVLHTVVSDPTYTFTQSESNWDYTWGTASRNYYAKLTPFDGISNGTANSAISFTLTDAIPSVSGQTSDSSVASPKYDGQNVAFSMTSHSDTDTLDNHTLRVCKTNSISTSGTCAGGEWCNEYGGVYSDDANLGCSYTLTASETSTTYDSYFFICDCPPNDLTCPGQCSTGYLHTFSVNHKPTATSVDITPDSPTTIQTLTCSYTFSDSDSDTQGTSTFKWYNYTGSLWAEVAVTTQTLSDTYTFSSETWMCEVTPVDQHSYVGSPVNSTTETIQNSAPNQPSDFKVQDGAASFDSTTLDTHDVTPNLQWNTSDPDSQGVTTEVCVATSASNRNSNICDVYSSSTGSDSVSSVTGLVFLGITRTYYVRLTPGDGVLNGTVLDTQFYLINSIPNAPSDLAPLNTHSQNPTLTFNASDADDGTNNHWPADTLTYYLRVGTAYGDGTYESNDNANYLGESVNNAIPWGTPGTDGYANTTVYASIWVVDFAGAKSDDLNKTINLYDYLPDITNIEMTDAGGTYSSCTSSSCAIYPIEHSNSTVAVKVTVTDTDNDCDSTSTGYVYLCLDTVGCSPLTGNYSWNLNSISRSGSTCTYRFSSNKTAVDATPEFFRSANSNYKLFVNVTGQGGQRLTDPEQVAPWTFGTLKAINYPSLVTLGDGSIDLNQWNSGTTLALMTNWGNDILDLTWLITDPANGPNIWNITGDDFQIDDDNSQSSEASGYISPVYLNGTTIAFQPGTGLQVCSADNCFDSSLNETLDTFYHIKPPLGLVAGTYNTTITITIS